MAESKGSSPHSGSINRPGLNVWFYVLVVFSLLGVLILSYSAINGFPWHWFR
jgi:hypothetical protein